MLNVKDIEGIRKFLDSDSQLELKTLPLAEEKLLWQINKLKQDTLAVKIKNRRELIHSLNAPPSMAIEITNGTVPFEKLFETDKQEHYLSWVGQKLICSKCGHEHFSSGSKVCYRTGCECTISVIQL